MANYVTAPFFAAIGVAEGIIAKTSELIGTVRGRGDLGDEGDEQQDGAEAEREPDE
jgi:hypothetical protein